MFSGRDCEPEGFSGNEVAGGRYPGLPYEARQRWRFVHLIARILRDSNAAKFSAKNVPLKLMQNKKKDMLRCIFFAFEKHQLIIVFIIM